MNDIAFSEAAATAQPVGILIAPQNVLRQVAHPVRPEDVGEIRLILPGMFAAMYAAPGIGLAAPQIGISRRFAIVDLGEKEERDPIIMLNPEVISESEEMSAREEGCLSLPNQYAEVTRPEAVRVRWTTLDGTVTEREVSGLLATCIQHEIDHLDGILFIDHLSTLRRNMIMRRLAKEQKQRRH
ncbi:peptide deformylase [Acetobacter sp. AN02]|uniref:peptide deformylase n=1 Tax=Acetobacter sp. AN02 TaxID=2894186 RepID=UPI00243467D8|nr:peptide deformylase [Acetobacter sp. AN02]MDG6095133.1 peptide deformylase [Acetobacter sp. AN02]